MKENYGFIAIDDVDIFELSDEELFVKQTPYKAHISDQKGIKYCLKDKNRLCHEECYGDDEFCEMVVFLGYPEDEVKYPNAYPIYL